MKIVEVRHPLVQHKLGKLRDVGTDPVLFRQLASEIAAMLAYEATREMPVETRSVPTWAGPLDVAHVRAEKVTLVPILRAGLGFLPGVQAMLPAAAVSVIGLRRNEVTHQPETYYERLADHMAERTAILIDPMLATGGSFDDTVAAVKRKGGKRIQIVSIVSAPEGIAHIGERHPDVPIITAAVDQKLNNRAYIVPGLGDFGDRYFGT